MRVGILGRCYSEALRSGTRNRGSSRCDTWYTVEGKVVTELDLGPHVVHAREVLEYIAHLIKEESLVLERKAPHSGWGGGSCAL